MAKYNISFAYYTPKPDGSKPGAGVTSTAARIDAPSEQMAIRILEDKYPGKKVEIRSIRAEG